MRFGTNPQDIDDTPLGSVYVPGTANSDLTTLEGMAINTDGNSQKSSAVRMGAKVGDVADLATLLGLAGTSADANTVASLMGRLTKIRDLLNTSLTVSGTVTETNSSSIKTDLDEIATDTDNLAGIKTDLDSLAGIVSSSKAAIKAASGDFADGAITTLGLEADANTVNTVMGRLTKIRDLLNTTLTVSGTITETNSTSIKSDLDEIATDTDNLAGMKTDLDSLVTNTADLLADGDNLPTIATNTGNTATNTSTIAGAVSSSKMATKAASGDFADGANVALGTTTQTKATDGTTTSWSAIQLLKGILDKLLGSIAVTGTFWQATQPVSGTVTANAGTNLNTSTLAIESGGNLATLVTNTNKIPSKGTATMSGSEPVTIATDDTVLSELLTDTDNLAGIKTDLDTLSGAVSSSKVATKAASGDFADGAIATLGAKADAKSTATDTTAITIMQVLKEISFMLQTPAALPVNQSTNMAQVAGTTTAVGAGTSSTGTQRVTNAGASTGAKTNVASSATSVTILASNTSRLGATVYNDSTQICYLDVTGGTASSTSYTVQLGPNQFFEVPGPNVYNGAITGIWASANGNARVTEWST